MGDLRTTSLRFHRCHLHFACGRIITLSPVPNWCPAPKPERQVASKPTSGANPTAEHTSCEVSPMGWETSFLGPLSHDNTDRFAFYPRYTSLVCKTRETYKTIWKILSHFNLTSFKIFYPDHLDSTANMYHTFYVQKSIFGENYKILNMNFWTHIDRKIWISNEKKNLKNLFQNDFFNFLKVYFGSKSGILRGKFNYLILFQNVMCINLINFQIWPTVKFEQIEFSTKIRDFLIVWYMQYYTYSCPQGSLKVFSTTPSCPTLTRNWFPQSAHTSLSNCRAGMPSGL